MIRKSVADRLKEKSIPEPNSGCWLWEGCISGGYGQIKINKRAILAHRSSYATFFCDPGEMYVLHKCDNPLCINPEHLFLGNHNDNMRDMVAKGRSLKGKANPMFGVVKTGAEHPMFGKPQSLKNKLTIQMTNIMRFHPYWGA